MNGYCEHKNVFPPNAGEVIGVVLLALLLGFANIGGIGGGCIVVPAAILLFGFNSLEAIAISNSTIFVGAFVKYFGFSIF